jgi:uncharacterized membrane protein YphA (DoxX/SURF4 family)
MNILLWVLQILLALQAIAGGAFKIVRFEDIANMPATKAFPRAVWTLLGAIEVICGLLLIIPAATKWMPILTPVGAALLALESLALALHFARFSTAMSGSNPFTYALGSTVVAAFVAYGRYALAPVV